MGVLRRGLFHGRLRLAGFDPATMPMVAYCDALHALTVETARSWKLDDALMEALREPYWITEETWVNTAEDEASWPMPAPLTASGP